MLPQSIPSGENHLSHGGENLNGSLWLRVMKKIKKIGCGCGLACKTAAAA